MTCCLVVSLINLKIVAMHVNVELVTVFLTKCVTCVVVVLMTEKLVLKDSHEYSLVQKCVCRYISQYNNTSDFIFKKILLW